MTCCRVDFKRVWRPRRRFCALADEVARARDVVAAIVGAAHRVGGTCTGEHGVGVGKLPFLAREHGAGALAAMHAIKARGVLSVRWMPAGAPFAAPPHPPRGGWALLWDSLGRGL